METLFFITAMSPFSILCFLVATLVVLLLLATLWFLRYRKRSKRRLNKLLGLITVRNSHDLKVLKDNEEKYRNIVRLMNEGVILTDSAHRIVFVNQCACKQLKKAEKELIGKKISEFTVGKAEATRLNELLDKNRAGTVAREEFMMCRSHEEPFWASLSFSFPGHLHNLHDGAVIVMVDVSGHIMLEQKMRKMTSNVVQKVKQLDCVFEMQQMLAKPDQTVDDILRKSLRIIPKGLRHENEMRVEILYNGKAYRAPGFHKSNWYYSIPLKTDHHRVGEMIVSYIGSHPPLHCQPFRIGEKVLLKNIAEKIMIAVTMVNEKADQTG